MLELEKALNTGPAPHYLPVIQVEPPSSPSDRLAAGRETSIGQGSVPSMAGLHVLVPTSQSCSKWK